MKDYRIISRGEFYERDNGVRPRRETNLVKLLYPIEVKHTGPCSHYISNGIMIIDIQEVADDYFIVKLTAYSKILDRTESKCYECDQIYGLRNCIDDNVRRYEP